MPGFAHRNDQFSNNAASTNGFWSKQRDELSYNQLQKFWSNLTVQARQELLKIDKQTFFEQARKNMYCSRCNGLLLEGFLQIVSHGKSFQQDGSDAHLSYSVTVASKSQQDGGMCVTNGCKDGFQDPSMHPWGGLATTRDGSLTLLDCYIVAKSLKGLQIVFDSSRVREREREVLYPDACGGGARGWISQGIATYGRGHGMRETCALHTARLSCNTLVDFWSALGEDTRQSLLRMKEEDFIERLMYRFDSKRFCRDCRRNVIREFKELKELKRMRREPRCTSCFCVADTAFQYEVSNDSVLADWHQTFSDSVGSYHHFEWALGTGEGMSDILEFENVGLRGSAQVSGLDLGGVNSCFITLRAWKLDGRCTEIFVKAHALKGQQCVHGRLVVGDGFVTITRGESIKKFFEHAEEAEEEEDDDSVDDDGNDLDGECSRPQKHAKSPELAREFLLDAAIVIFKEQVEKAFREGTARQNAHSVFLCLAQKLLEERVHIACKEIITYEKQMKLLEEEEKEKREEEDRKERRRAKEREKKLRRKERLKGKDKDSADKKSPLDDTNTLSLSNAPKEEESLPSTDKDVGCEDDLIGANGDATSHVEYDEAYQYTTLLEEDNHFSENTEADFTYTYDGCGSFTSEQSGHSNGKSKFRKDRKTADQAFKWSERRWFAVVSENSSVGNNRSLPRYHNDNTPDRSTYGSHRKMKPNTQKTSSRSSASKCSEKFHYGNNRMNERYDGLTNPCGCNPMNDYRPNTTIELPVSAVRSGRESSKYMVKSESALDVSKHFYRGSKYNQTEPYTRQGGVGRLKFKAMANKESPLLQFRKVWEPLESSQKRYSRSNSESDVTLMESNFKPAEVESSDSTKSSSELCSSEDSRDSIELDSKNANLKDVANCETDDDPSKESPKATVSEEDTEVCPIERRTANSDNCSTCLSEEVESNTPSSNYGNPESSSTSDSEDTCHQPKRVVAESCISRQVEIEPQEEAKKRNNAADSKCSFTTNIGYKNQAVLPQIPQQGQNLFLQVLQSPSTLGYYPQNVVSWTSFPPNGLFTHPPNSYIYGGPLTYGLEGNPGFCVPYDTMPPPHLTAAPMINGTPAFSNPPPYQPMSQIRRQNVGHQVMDSVKGEKIARPSEALKVDDGIGVRQFSISSHEKKNSGFSLFHFGGPVAFFDMPKSNEEAGVISSEECIKKETAVEEYNLFEASNGMRFSIF